MNVRNAVCRLPLLAFALCVGTGDAAEMSCTGCPPPPKVESAYPVMCWTNYRFEEALDWDYTVDNWVRLGINRPLTPVVDGKTDKARFRAFLDTCHAAGLKVYVYDNRIAGDGLASTFLKTKDEAAYRAACRAVRTDWADHPAVCGFYVHDEPDAPDASATFRAARIQLEEIPGKEPFLNLLPFSPALADRIGSKELIPYLERCARESGLKFFGYDCYVQQERRKSRLDFYFSNLRGWSTFGKQSGNRWNTTLLCSQHFNYELSRPDDFRWQISTAAAMGANGLCWFYPDHHTGPHLNYRDAPIDAFGERTETFAWMGREMRLFQHQFGAEFAKLRFESAAMVACAYGGIPEFKGDADLTDVGGLNDKKAPFLVSFFRDAKGVRYAVIVNLNQEVGGSCRLRLAFAKGVVPFTKGWNDWRKLSPTQHFVYLAPGQLELLRLERTK